jgi:hypothetical protein
VNSAIERILAMDDLITFWDFQEPPGEPRIGRGPQRSILLEAGGQVPVMPQGLFGPVSAHFGAGAYLYIPRRELGRLNIHGPEAQVTLVAWLERHASGAERACEAVAGLWNEHARRQYAMFLNLRIHDSAQQLGAHISGIGGATPGYKYCMEAAIGATPIGYETWHCLAITYDGVEARAYVDGRLDERPVRNPYRYEHGIYSAGDDGADFTIGAVTRPETVTEDFRDIGSIVSNRFHGQLAGLAVFHRALSPREIVQLSAVIARSEGGRQ